MNQCEPAQHKKGSWLAVVLLAAVVLGGCAGGLQYQRPTLSLPQEYPAQAQPSQGTQVSKDLTGQWWLLFEDTELTQLVESALRQNTDLQQAVARIDQAEAQLQQAQTALWPQVNAGGSASRDKASTTTGEDNNSGVSNTFRGVASTSFEIDFWGKLRSASAASRAQLLASQYGAEVVRQTIVSSVAHSYFGVVTLDRQIKLSRDTLQARNEDVRLQHLRLAQGAVGRLDMEQSEGQRAEAALQLREFERQRAVFVAQLGLLTGQTGLVLPSTEARIHNNPPVPPTGVPSQLLERRPDVRQAEQLLIAAQAEIDVARAAMFPNISLTGLAGGESAELADIFKNGSRIWSLGFGLNLPLFDAGRRLAVTKQAKARQVEAVAAYQGAVQSAFKDVSEALANLEAARTSLADAEVRDRSALSSLQIAQKRYMAGYSGYLELLDAQRTSNNAQLQTLSIRQALFNASVDLCKALGGGWGKDRS